LRKIRHGKTRFFRSHFSRADSHSKIIVIPSGVSRKESAVYGGNNASV
jgi:hypothetical protein